MDVIVQAHKWLRNEPTELGGTQIVRELLKLLGMYKPITKQRKDKENAN